MTLAQETKLRSIIEACSSDTLSTAAGRRGLASRISDSLNIWEDTALSFIQDMRGLDLALAEDRESFLQLAIIGLV